MPECQPAARTECAWWLHLAPGVVAYLAFGSVTSFGTVCDDLPALVENVPLRSGRWLEAAFGAHTPLSNRPLTCLLFATEWRMGLSFGGMHLVSVLMHVANAILLSVLLTQLVTRFRGRLGRRTEVSAWYGVVTAAVWAAHPMMCDAVAYLTQQSILLMAIFVLAALLGTIRVYSAQSRRSLAMWPVLTVGAVGLAMCCKEECAALPLLLLLFQRAFLAATWRDVFARWRFQVCTIATYCILGTCVLFGPANPTVGYSTSPTVTAHEWLYTQAPIIIHYLRSLLWPDDLRGLYDFPVVRSLQAVLIPGALVAAALVATVVCWRRAPVIGFCGAWFFLLLAPSSSILPLITEPCADRRMYLPSMAVFALAMSSIWVVAVRRNRGVLRSIAVSMVMVVIITEIHVTRCVAHGYRDDSSLSCVAFSKNELENRSHMAGRILAWQAKVLHERGEMAKSHELLERVLACQDIGRIELLNVANMRQEQKRLGEAEAILRHLISRHPDYAEAYGNLAGVILDNLRQAGSHDSQSFAEAEGLLRSAIALKETSAEIHNTMGVLLYAMGRTNECLAHLMKAKELRPDLVEPRRNLGVALLELGRVEDALAEWQTVRIELPRDPLVRLQMAGAYVSIGNRERAIELLRECLSVDPGFSPARELLGRIQ